jgi:hypothetical protein
MKFSCTLFNNLVQEKSGRARFWNLNQPGILSLRTGWLKIKSLLPLLVIASPTFARTYLALLVTDCD